MSGDALALVAWAGLAEPLDKEAAWLVWTLGASGALAWTERAAADPVGASHELLSHAAPGVVDAVVGALGRWTGRDRPAPAREIERAARAGARVIVRGSDEWPAPLDDWGPFAPYALWVKGDRPLAELLATGVALVGSRASTSYGDHMAATLAGGCVDAGRAVISGGAYGIDGAAHRAALAAGGSTVAVMAGGVDRPYPAGHAHLLDQIAAQGAVISEFPIGAAHHRSRFLARNRLIAAAAATCVVEAAHRSGALNTARHALDLARPVAAVPGAATSAASHGCHRLIRRGEAVLVTDAQELLELAGPIGPDADCSVPGGFASAAQRQAFDAVGVRGSTVDQVASGAGLSAREALAALAALETSGLVRRDGPRWKRAAPG